ncbi:MAG: sigma-70 family RNA polymerase sigma factor [Treponema sp.]|nr:sigma-70 family RNA polymerase sigma factor [Treponema sp.]
MSVVVASESGEPSDAEVISRVLGGDTEAYAILVRRHRSRVFRLGMGFFHDEDDAADFAQDVFIKAYTALGSFRGRSQFSTWLLRIAYNTAINAKKRRKEQLPLDGEELVGAPGVDETHLRDEALQAVRDAIVDLPPRQALCIELFFYYDLKYVEISEITGFPVNTIKSHVFRAKRFLRLRLGGGSEADRAL